MKKAARTPWNPRLVLLGIHVPKHLRRRELERLFAATARAFAVAVPDAENGSPESRLEQYARFTRDRARELITCGETAAAAGEALYREAFRLGGEYRERLGVRTRNEELQAAAVLYRCLGIELLHDGENTIIIPRCLFSAYYSAGICAFVSALDRGLLAGLTGGAGLRFRRRITEGSPACEAVLEAGCRGEI